jgi:hypothetical protein
LAYLAPAVKFSIVLAFVNRDTAHKKNTAEIAIVTSRPAALEILNNTTTGVIKTAVASHELSARLSVRRCGPGRKICSSDVSLCRRFMGMVGKI